MTLFNLWLMIWPSKSQLVSYITMSNLSDSNHGIWPLHMKIFISSRKMDMTPQNITKWWIYMNTTLIHLILILTLIFISSILMKHWHYWLNRVKMETTLLRRVVDWDWEVKELMSIMRSEIDRMKKLKHWPILLSQLVLQSMDKVTMWTFTQPHTYQTVKAINIDSVLSSYQDYQVFQVYQTPIKMLSQSTENCTS